MSTSPGAGYVPQCSECGASDGEPHFVDNETRQRAMREIQETGRTGIVPVSITPNSNFIQSGDGYLRRTELPNQQFGWRNLPPVSTMMSVRQSYEQAPQSFSNISGPYLSFSPEQGLTPLTQAEPRSPTFNKNKELAIKAGYKLQGGKWVKI